MTVTFVGSVKSIYLNNIDCHMRCMIKSAIKIMIELIAKKPVISFASWFMSSCSLTFAGDCGLKTVVILKIFDVWIAHHAHLFACYFSDDVPNGSLLAEWFKWFALPGRNQAVLIIRFEIYSLCLLDWAWFCFQKSLKLQDLPLFLDLSKRFLNQD